jgi:hypothetical protein
MSEVLELVVPNALMWALTFALFAWDERRMTEAQRARAWPVASRRIAVVMFAPMCVPIHFVRTRRSARGVIEAVGWTIALFAAFFVVALVLDAIWPE